MTAPTSTPDAALLDIYKLGAELADRVSARRATANAFFLTVETSLIAVVSLRRPDLRDTPLLASAVLALSGIVLAASWWRLLRAYQHLNEAKFAVLNDLEQRLPARLFTDEWALLQAKAKPRYFELGQIERLVPWVFAVLWIFLLVARVTA